MTFKIILDEMKSFYLLLAKLWHLPGIILVPCHMTSLIQVINNNVNKLWRNNSLDRPYFKVIALILIFSKARRGRKHLRFSPLSLSN